MEGHISKNIWVHKLNLKSIKNKQTTKKPIRDKKYLFITIFI